MGWLAERVAAASRELDARFNIKTVHRRLQAVAKVLIVTTFMEDALRAVLTFEVQQNTMRIAGWQSPLLHVLLPVVSFVVQGVGSLLVVLPGNHHRALFGCYMLIAWCAWHPFMYKQQTNWEFVLETLTIMGGLAILVSHFMLALPNAKAGLPRVHSSTADTPHNNRAHRIQALGRLLVCSIFLYYAFEQVHRFAKRHNIASQDDGGWKTAAVEGVLIVALLYMCSLVIIGIKSRWVAMALAIAMALSDVYMHPFWRFIFSAETHVIEGVAGMEGVEVDAFTMADHQRYFFFQSMSTVGALLLLVVHGPGKLSIDEQDGPMQLITTKGDA
ncbi:hypothetical protein AB1Y20_013094 [Prymnesium parvum]|uniref:Uncharacterized protein n=1 Tax=Prymnesium parvum TaxID=97485 RepID=A0AB34IL61_PRYPA